MPLNARVPFQLAARGTWTIPALIAAACSTAVSQPFPYTPPRDGERAAEVGPRRLKQAELDRLRGITPPPPRLPASPSTSASIDANFPALDLFDSQFIPPDTMGAVGPNHFMATLNGVIGVFSKNGGRLAVRTLDLFFDRITPNPATNTFDPRVLFDPNTGRWFVIAAASFPTTGDSALALAVSRTDDPSNLRLWDGYVIDADPNNQEFFDFPSLGLDADALYVAANMFPVTVGGVFGINIIIIPTAPLVSSLPSLGFTLFENVSFFDVGASLNPAVDLSGGGFPNVFLSDFATPSGVIQQTLTSGTPESPILVSGPAVSVPAFDPPPLVSQGVFTTPKSPIDAGDNRFGSYTIIQGPNLWAVQGVEVANSAAIRWLRISASTGALLETGTLAPAGMDVYYPSIAVNAMGDILVGCSGSSQTQPISTYAFTGHFDGTTTTFDPPTLTRQGVSDYEILDSIGRNRWGDYSATSIDPTNPRRIWTIQQYTASTDVWGTQVTEFVFGDGIAPCNPADLAEPFDSLDFNDIEAFVVSFLGGSLTADLSGDGALDFEDIEAFVELFLGGCP